ncbi:hypothetical protein A1O7_02097 [Cladophialophora yegresii CBS 114405]|uniref:Major facilitator superfamily (MFS) profile domain-containing protein n=1 Tax=Cladophialophora yegresii CBS 114405 TaxID=1182544 RepID=W9W140_9EURO|nr:uncharacterized protein A1O7_02097 [Cladophialophora yegresii CBS 114405]EXJ61668.1 hypothetical protein A1O7_02097 [Cladophialophora yegresii CBS 114405]
MAEKDISQTTEVIENAALADERERQRQHAAEFEPPALHVQELNEAEHINLSWRSWLVVFVTCFAIMAQVFVVVAAGSVIAFIIRDLGGAPIAGWIIQGPLLMQSVLSPIVGRLSDVLDRKWLASIPPLIAFAGAVISAKATSMSMLIGGGILIGTTLSTIAIVQAIPSEVLPLKYRALANGFAFMGGAIGGLVGGLGAGGVTNASPDGWRDIFWMQAAFHLATFLGLFFFYHPTRRSDYPKMSFRQYVWAIDPIGSSLFVVACTLLLLALDWAGGAYEWSDAHVAAPLGIGCGFLVLFCLYEWKGRDDGIVAHVFFKGSPNFALSVFSFAVEGWIFYSAVNSVTPQIVLNLGFQTDAWKISIRQLSYSLVTLVASIPITLYATKYKDLKTPLIVTFTVFLVVCILYSTVRPSWNQAQYGINVLSGIGQSGPLTLIVALIQFTAPHAFLSTATGLGFSARAIGGAFGSAVLDAIINGKLKSYPAKVGGAAIEAGLPASSVPALLTALSSGAGLTDVPGINATIIEQTMDASHWAYARAYRMAWASIIPFVVLALVGVWFLKGVKELMTEKVEATVEHVNQADQEKA